MNIYEDKVEVNAGLLIILVYIAISWFGGFQKIEGWFSHSELATVRISDEIINFYSIKTNKLIYAKCVRSCEEQVGLLSPYVSYRIKVTNFPIVGKRILNVEKWNY